MFIQMTTKDFKCHINLVEKATEGFEKSDFNFKRNSTVGKMLSNSMTGYGEVFYERKSQSVRQTLLSHFKKLPQLSAATTLLRLQPSAWRQDPLPAKRLHLAEGLADGYHFNNQSVFS